MIQERPRLKGGGRERSYTAKCSQNVLGSRFESAICFLGNVISLSLSHESEGRNSLATGVWKDDLVPELSRNLNITEKLAKFTKRLMKNIAFY